MKKKFWLVWCQNYGNPTYKHDSQESAVAEAERLARRFGGQFHVLEMVGTVERDDLKWSAPTDDRLGTSHGDSGDASSPHVVADADECSCNCTRTGHQLCGYCRKLAHNY